MLCETCRFNERPGFVRAPRAAHASDHGGLIPCLDCGGQGSPIVAMAPASNLKAFRSTNLHVNRNSIMPRSTAAMDDLRS